MGQFADKLAAFKVEAVQTYHDVVREVVIEAGARLVGRSPIGDPALWKRSPPKGYVGGKFASNWNYATESPDRSTTEQTGIRTVNFIAEIPREAGNFVHFITNATPYGPALERGHSSQAPNGMVVLTELEFPSIVGLAINRARS